MKFEGHHGAGHGGFYRLFVVLAFIDKKGAEKQPGDSRLTF